MVSIAESLNYRIFERKWRPGEVFNGHPRACRISQCRTKTQPTTKESGLVEGVFARRRRLGGYPGFSTYRRFMGSELCVCCGCRATSHEAARAPRPPDGHTCFGACDHPGHQTSVKEFSSFSLSTSFVTDLSAAGSPAELKHITQRRKRKQP